METRTKAYIEFEEKLEKLDNSNKYSKMLKIPPDEMTDEDWELWNEYNKKVEKLFENVIEDSYKELYDLFQKVTGGTIEFFEVDWEFFKTMVDENLGYDEMVYNLYFPDLVVKFQEVGKKWFEQKYPSIGVIS